MHTITNLDGGTPGASIELARNLTRVPSFELPTGTVELRRNYVRSPFGTVAMPGYFAWPGASAANEQITGAVSIVGWAAFPVPGHPTTALRLVLPAGAAVGGGVVLAPSLPAGSYRVSMLVNRLSGPATSLQFALRGVRQIGAGRTFAYNTWTYITETFTVAAGETSAPFGFRSLVNDPAETTFLIGNMQIAPLGQDSPQGSLVLSGSGAGYDPELLPTWAGTANASDSILAGPGVAGVTTIVGAPVQSKLWAHSGVASLRIFPGAGQSSRAAVASLPTVPGQTYTIVATVHLAAPLTGALSQYSRIIEMYEAATNAFHRSPAPPNTAGEHEVRLTYTATAPVGSLRLWNGAAEGGGEVWWDSVTIVEGTYAGPAFDGDSPDAPDEDLFHDWTGTPHNSASIYRRQTWSILNKTRPLAVAGYATDLQSRNEFHDLLDGSIGVSYVPPRPRSGTLVTVYDDRAAAFAAVAMYRAGKTFRYASTDLAELGMDFALDGVLSVEQDGDDTDVWYVLVGYQEV